MLSVETIDRDPSSYVDPHGFVFHHDGEIYRYIFPEAAERYKSLLENGVLAKLERECALVSSEAVTGSIKGLPEGMLLHHPRISPLTYCVEWCPSMLRDAGINTLQLALVANEHNLTLQDAYPWNVLFDGPKPVFVDVTSLTEPDERVIWPAHDQFAAFFLRPLILASQRRGDVARALLYDNLQGITLDQLYRLTPARYHLVHPGLGLSWRLDRWLQKSTWAKNRIRRLAEKSCGITDPALRRRFLETLLKKLRKFRFSKAGDPWADYYAAIDESFDKKAKVLKVESMLSELGPATVLDLGCNTGVFSIVAANTGARVVSVDSSESCIEVLYDVAKTQDLPITPLISNVLCPTPQFGYMAEQYPSLWDRVESEAVLCLGLMHHLHLTGRQSWERIVELLDRVTQRYLIFEFVAIDDANIDHLPQRREISYSLDTVADALRARFPDISIHDSDRPTRKLLLCKK